MPGSLSFLSFRQAGLLQCSPVFLYFFSGEIKKSFKKVKKICFFLRNALDKRFSRAILLVLTGQTGNNASPEKQNRKGKKMEKAIKKMEKDIINVDELLEWGDSYDGTLPALDPCDYATDEELEAADEDRRRQYWRLTGTIATSRAAWEAALAKEGAEKGSEYWLAAEKVAASFRDLLDEDDDYWPVDCHLAYERGDGDEDPLDSIEGSGSYSIIDL